MMKVVNTISTAKILARASFLGAVGMALDEVSDTTKKHAIINDILGLMAKSTRDNLLRQADDVKFDGLSGALKAEQEALIRADDAESKKNREQIEKSRLIRREAEEDPDVKMMRETIAEAKRTLKMQQAALEAKRAVVRVEKKARLEQIGKPKPLYATVPPRDGSTSPIARDGTHA